MEIIVAKSAGFCFGVKNAVEEAEKASKLEGKTVTLGPIIHNRQVVDDLKSKNVDIINSADELQEGLRVVIRSHGISKSEYEEIKKKGGEIVDATCPNVKNIHKIVEEKYNLGYQIIIIGDASHPEVAGINGWCMNSAIIINKDEDLESLKDSYDKLCIVCQTTFNKDKWYGLVCKLLKHSSEVLIYNTICASTQLRQSEAVELSKNVDAVIVIGGKESSNTRRLYEVCLENCKNVYYVESADELNIDDFKNLNKVGVTAGASTPEYLINEVTDRLKGLSEDAVVSNMNENDAGRMECADDTKNEDLDAVMSENNEDNAEDNAQKMECAEEPKNEEPEAVKPESDKAAVKEEKETSEMDKYFMGYEEVYPGSIVTGKVLLVTDKEVFIDIGYKADALLPMEEISNFPVDIKDKFKAGDTVKVEVIKLNDGDGNVIVSKKSLEKEEFINNLTKYKTEGTPIEISITGVNKGGFECQYGSINAFMPLSQSGNLNAENIDNIKGQKLQAVIIDIKDRKDTKELIVSRRELIKKEKEKKTAEFVNSKECGDIVEGTVRTIINAGAFIDADGVDLFVPISEISWKRINNPHDALKEGETVNALIIKINRDEMKITASIKRTGKDPWTEFLENHKEGDVVKGNAARIVPYGVFVELTDGVDGLLHISNMADERINKPTDVVKQNQEVEVKIIKIDGENKKISLSMKDIDK